MFLKKIQWLACIFILLLLPVSASAAPLNEIKDYVESLYVGEIKGDLQKASSAEQIIDMLDPYSAYFTAEEFEAFINSIEMTSVGIGIVIEEHSKGIYISDVIKGGTAEQAGIAIGDIITHIDGKEAANLTTSQASSLILGEENTSVTLTVLTSNGQSITKTIVRKPFSLPNGTSKLLYGNVGYIALSSFSSDAAGLVKKAIRDLTANGATSFILDLQDNGGGYVTAAEEVIGLFPNAKDAYTYEDASGSYLIRAKRQSIQFPKDTRVLINRYSASASEMTAAALVDQKAAILYGERSYGKGTMQSFYELSDGSYLKLTMAQFAGPTTTVINHVGVKPHIETSDNGIYRAHYDAVAANLPAYRELAALKNVPATKTFTVNFNHDLTTVPADTIDLVKLGDGRIDAEVKVEGSKVLIKPKVALTSGGHYMLVVHPNIKGLNSTMKKGSYLYITVK
ncbi:S41 family peptidase [Lysinibacillus odysseyi]|uniref:S41 family peptidase n=1 Tax=Lysinibacillus odysseyi TaxID=202611 RepID=UPI003899037C